MGVCVHIRLPRRRWRSVSRGRVILSVCLLALRGRRLQLSTPKISAASPTSSTRCARSTCCRASRRRPGPSTTGVGQPAGPQTYLGENGAQARDLSNVVGAQPAPSGEGFELNFENTPVTGVAKVVLGDILQVGYLIDPRVQGTITLASGRPVPKGDLLYVLESALRTQRRRAGAGQARLRHSAGDRCGRPGARRHRGARRAGLRHHGRSAAVRLGDDAREAARQFRREARQRSRRPAAQPRAGAGQRRGPAQRGRDHAELRCRLDARPVGRHLSGAQLHARADHQRARADHGFGRGRLEPEPRQAAADRAAQCRHGHHQQAGAAAAPQRPGSRGSTSPTPPRPA